MSKKVYQHMKARPSIEVLKERGILDNMEFYDNSNNIKKREYENENVEKKIIKNYIKMYYVVKYGKLKNVNHYN